MKRVGWKALAGFTALILGSMVGGRVMPAQDAGATAAAPGTPNLPCLVPGAEILSDTMGVDFSGYMRRLHDDIMRNWDPLIPAKAQPPEGKKGIVSVRFTILP